MRVRNVMIFPYRAVIRTKGRRYLTLGPISHSQFNLEITKSTKFPFRRPSRINHTWWSPLLENLPLFFLLKGMPCKMFKLLGGEIRRNKTYKLQGRESLRRAQKTRKENIGQIRWVNGICTTTRTTKVMGSKISTSCKIGHQRKI